MKRWVLGICMLGTSLQSAFAVTKVTGDAKKGEAIFQKTCVTCHGPDAMGLKEQDAPMIRHQHDWYLYKQLTDFKAKKRDNPKMFPFIKDLSDQDFKDVATYLAKLERLDSKH